MSPPLVQAAIGLGGNVGDSITRLRAAMDALDTLPGCRVTARSPLYRTPAWGVTEQEDFINAVVLLQTGLLPLALLDSMLKIERAHGRNRSTETRWGPRTLDLDLLLYGDAQLDLPGLQVPHPQMHRRAFVLVPLLAVDADAVIPGIGSAQAMLAQLDDAQIAELTNLS